MYMIKPAKAVTLLTGIWQVLSSNLGWGTIFFVCIITSHYATTAFRSLTEYPAIRGSTVTGIEGVVTKPQNNT
jgi:hypothetical protein